MIASPTAKEATMYSTNGTAMTHHHTDLQEGEKRVPQYGPEWLAHLAAGGAIREGNILIPLA